jgi:putative transcriptional regulator
MGGVTTSLPALRAEYRLTQAELATLAAVSRQTINSIETGRFEPSLSLALKLARLFDRPVDALFALDETEVERAAARTLAPPAPRFAAP